MRMTLQASHMRRDRPKKTLKPGQRNATVVAVAAQKGGVGKTTTSVCLASACARFHGMRVLLVDLDPQSHCNVALRDVVEIAEQPGRHLISVRDNGKGIASDEHERIFEAFHTLGARSGRGESTGIGLAIVKKIALTHGGRVWVESEPGEGAAFHLALPRA